MATITLHAAMAEINRYFSPLTVNSLHISPITMDVELVDTTSNLSVILPAIPCRPHVTMMELYQLINLIERQAKTHHPEIFSSHVQNLMGRN